MKLINIGKKISILLFTLNLLFSNTYCSEDKLSIQTVNQNLASSNTLNTNLNSNSKYSLNGGIFVSEKFLKKKDINNAVSPIAANSKNSINDAFRSDSDLADKSNLGQVLGMNKNAYSSSDLTIVGGPIFQEIWVKYFKYTDNDLNIGTPKHFFLNNEYYNQMKMFPDANLKEIDNIGQSTYIRDKSYFYALLFSKTLNFVTSRQVQFQKTYDSLNLSFIDTIPEDKEDLTGGITDFGNYNEGFCFKITTVKPKKTNWVLCADSLEQKNNIISILRKLKLKSQREEGIYAFSKQINKETLSSVLNPQSTDLGPNQHLRKDKDGNLGVIFGAEQKITDGYWIVLQDWTQCSLKCGGGISTLHRMCVPPKNGGAPCKQPGILTRPCNTHPCPNIRGTDESTKNNTFTMKPIVKVMPFSSRPQRYTKCVIKESDLMLTHKKGNNINNNPLLDGFDETTDQIQIPTRVIMNNRTLSIFSGEDYHTLVTVFNLEDTNFFRSRKHKSCFLLIESKMKEVELCPFGCSDTVKAVDEWDEHFHLFKNQCRTARDIINIDQASLDKKLQEKINEAKNQLLIEREKEIKDKLKEKEQGDIKVVIKKTNDVALQAIKKEINLEELIKQEEEEREERIEKELRIKIEKEKERSECIRQKIKERKLENQNNEKTKEAEEQIIKIKSEAAQQVLIRRSQLKNLIADMRKKSLSRQGKLQQELHSVRVSVAEEMGKAYRKGDINKCLAAQKDEAGKNAYCQGNFVDDYDTYTNCVSGEDFCNLCCDNEFGEINVKERLECYKKVCPSKKEAAAKMAGRWIWQNEIGSPDQ